VGWALAPCDGQIIGTTLREQTAQALTNVEAALGAADATVADIVSWRIAVVDELALADGFAEFQAR
jgi:enamine deaminase RidA (YjgF/YER057c/UK114 family)